MSRKLAHAAFAGAVLASTALLAAPSAQAAGRDGVCQTGEFCVHVSIQNPYGD